MSDTTDQDCRRLGLRCVDCLPVSRWCDLCTAAHACLVYQVEQRNTDWGYDTLDVVSDLAAARRLAQRAARVWAREHDRAPEELFWTQSTDPATGRDVERSWGDVFRITTYALTFA